MSKISENLKVINDRIAEAAARGGRRREDVRLVCVSKTVGPEEVREAYAAGQRDFAENRVQKLVEKQEALRDLADISWHLIGQLQTNKIKYCADKVAMIHSLDRAALATALDRFAAKKGITVDCLLEVNISGEESKTGLPLGEVDAFMEEFARTGNIRLRGVMTMAPEGAPEGVLRSVFAGAAELAEKIRRMNVPNAPMGELSMGMSGDYEIAVEEGATLVRIGTACFR
ncbi:MAG: YggS family pyridoxal phosphate-dependent enzyme [Clostridia bacterium]|nr:YggS family pyridoxal phosphate-dependent enzyme [Clostridia bacterium]MBP5767173.1 YggS family pyridoxal phosphate-dependent enzyme [Clostridia bacterium]MBR5006216.1 YggS family pyridoxal phosphate-dependent enzyme [Clostridia bacterium]